MANLLSGFVTEVVLGAKQVTSSSNIDFENGSVIFQGGVCERRGLRKKPSGNNESAIQSGPNCAL